MHENLAAASSIPLTSIGHDGQFCPGVGAFRACAAQVFVDGDRVLLPPAPILLRLARANPSQGGGAKLPVCQSQIAGSPTIASSYWRELTVPLLAACSSDYTEEIRKS